MNEYSPLDSGADQGNQSLPAPLAPEPAPARRQHSYMSDDVDQLVAALSRAHAQIRNPPRNKTARVTSKRTQQTYTFSYATLDCVLDAVRLPLAEHGLALTQIPIGDNLITLLLHTSGQWLRCSMTIATNGNMQDLASAITSARRLSIQALLGISGEEDDDGAMASGNTVHAHGPSAAEQRRQRQQRDDPTELPQEDPSHPLIGLARSVADPAGAAELLNAWADELPRLHLMREDPSQMEMWNALFSEARAAISRALGKIVSAAWASWEMAETEAHVQKIDEKWNGSWSDTMGEFIAKEPTVYNALFRCTEGARKRILRSAPPKSHAEPVKAPAPAFRFCVLDEFGEVASDEHTSPDSWAMACANIAMGLPDQATWEELQAHNGDAIALARQQSPAAAQVLDSLDRMEPESPAFKTPEPQGSLEPARTPAFHDWTVPMVEDRGGRINLFAYVAALETALQMVGAQDVDAWETANQANIHNERIPASTRMKIIKIIAAHKRSLGIPPKNSAASA